VIPAVLSGLQPPASSLSLTWNFENKLASSDIDANGTADVSFQYDALGRRVARTGTGGSYVFVQMDQQTIADYPVGGAASTPTYRYVYASYIDEPVVRKGAGAGGTLVYFHRNHQYSITAVTTSTGAIAERYAYTAYGQPTILDASASVLSSSAINNRYTFTGREWDATLGLHHFRARWMSAIAGRFLSRDSIGYEGSEWGLYEFATSRTFTRLDPSGLKCCIFSWLTSSTGHSALKCGPAPENYPSYGSYYSMYPDGPHLESDDRKNGPPTSVICIDCLNEMAISSKWLQIEHQRYCMVGGNCSSYIGQLLDAGIVSSDSSKACPSSPPCPRCQEDVGCHNSCAGSIRGGIPGPDLPSNALSYFKCLKNVNCDPWVRACRRDPNFDYGPKY